MGPAPQGGRIVKTQGFLTPESGNSVKNSAALPFSGPNCEDVSGEGFGTESDLELELVQSSANFDCN